MRSSFPVEQTLPQQLSSAHSASISLTDSVVLSNYVEITCQNIILGTVSQRAVYEAGIYKVYLESELGQSVPKQQICLLALTNSD